MTGLFFASAADRLAALDTHIALSHHSVAEQAQRVTSLKEAGRNTTGATTRLADMMEILDGLYIERHRLIAERWRTGDAGEDPDRSPARNGVAA